MSAMMKFVEAAADPSSRLRPIHSLNACHVREVIKALSRMAGNWSLERHEGCDGDVLVFLVPRDNEVECLVIHRDATGFHLIANQGDACRQLGRFAAMERLLAALASFSHDVIAHRQVGASRRPARSRSCG